MPAPNLLDLLGGAEPEELAPEEPVLGLHVPAIAPSIVRFLPRSALAQEQNSDTADAWAASARQSLAERWARPHEEALGTLRAATEPRNLLERLQQFGARGAPEGGPGELVRVATELPGLLLGQAVSGLGKTTEQIAEGVPAEGAAALIPTIAELTLPSSPAARLGRGRATFEGFNQLAPGAAVGEKVTSALDILERQVADRWAILNRIGPETEEVVGLFAGRMAAGTQRAVDDLGAALKTAGADLPLLNEMVGLKRFIETATLKGGPSAKRLGAGGLASADEAAQALAQLTEEVGPERFARLEAADRMRAQALDRLRADFVDAGLFDAASVEKFRELHPDYNPTVLLRYLGESGAGSARLQQRTNLLHRLTSQGSADDQLPPMQAALKALVEGDIAIRRNLLIRTMVAEGGFKVESPKSFTTGPLIRAISEFGEAGDVRGALGTVVTRRPKTEKGIVHFFQGGKSMIAQVPPDVERTINLLNTESLNALERVALGVNRAFRLGATQVNPAFLAVNAIRDFVSAFVREGVLPHESVAGMVEAFTKAPAYRQFIRAGGGFGQEGGLFARGAELPKNLAEFEKKVARDGGLVIKKPSDVMRLLGQVATMAPVRAIGEAVEQGPRIATFKKRLAAGQAESTAALAGRRVTVDFSRSGEFVRHLNAGVPFLNARVQGAENFARTLRDIPESRFRVGGLMTAAVALGVANSQIPESADIPDYIKRTSLYLAFPGSGVPNPRGPGFERVKFVSLPVGDYGALTYPISALMDQIRDPAGLDAMAILWNELNSVSPIQDPTSLLPAPASSLAEQVANYDPFRGRPIVTEALAARPAQLQYTQYTPEIAKAIAAAVVDVPGLPDALKSPIRIQHLIESNLGGGGRLAEQAVSTLMGQPADKPLAAGLVGGVYRTFGGEVNQKAYRDRDVALRALNSEYRPLIEAFARNGVNAAQAAPHDLALGAFPLYPAEQAEREKYKLQFLTKLVQGRDLDTALARIPEEQRALRADMLSALLATAGEIAEAQVVNAIPRPELRRRLEQRVAGPQAPSRLFPQPEYAPVGPDGSVGSRQGKAESGTTKP